MSGRIWPGALCVITDSIAGNNGRIVTCLYPVGCFGYRRPDGSRREEVFWAVDAMLRAFDGSVDNEIQESALTPITPPPGTTSDTAPSEIEPAHPGWG